MNLNAKAKEKNKIKPIAAIYPQKGRSIFYKTMPIYNT